MSDRTLTAGTAVAIAFPPDFIKRVSRPVLNTSMKKLSGAAVQNAMPARKRRLSDFDVAVCWAMLSKILCRIARKDRVCAQQAEGRKGEIPRSAMTPPAVGYIGDELCVALIERS